jgi:hypothetical protein
MLYKTAIQSRRSPRRHAQARPTSVQEMLREVQ